MAEIGANGIVDLAVTTKGTPVKGSDLFGMAMTHFGSEVRGIRGNFIDDNLRTVNELTAQGMPVERAINYTWTARMAWEYGFTNVSLLTADGTPGNYKKVSALYQ
jgi:hypothetical protein